MPGRERDATESLVLAELRDAGYQVDVDITPGKGYVTLTIHGAPCKAVPPFVHGVSHKAVPAVEDDRVIRGSRTPSPAVGVDVDAVLTTAVHRVEMRAASKRVAATLHDLPVVPPPARVAALAKVEQRWRNIQSEYGLLNSQQIKRLTGSRAANTSSAASKLRADDKALSVRKNRELLFPAFQFADDGTIYPVIPTLLTVMGRDAGWTNQSIILWLTAPNGYMPGGGRPADHLADEVAVLRAAHAAVSPV